MIRFLKWFLVIAALVTLYIQLGGSDFLKKFGKGSVEVGEKVEEIEKKAKDRYRDISKKVEKKVKKFKREVMEKD